MPDSVDIVRHALAGAYAVEREIGSGGMATVYLARDLKHEREVAIKVLRPDLAAAVGSERFLREIKITAQLNHPHILPLLDSGATDSLVYYVMPYEAGGSLRRMIRKGRPVPLDTVVRIAGQVASALDYAHRHGVIHRDIKPENILLSEGHAIVSDFGVARAVSAMELDALTRSGFPLGTPGYMSPEQAAGLLDLNERTDVYGLASVVYEMLIGETPGMWPTDEAVRLGRFIDAAPGHRPLLDLLPGRVEQVLTRALALRPADRFASPGEFTEALALVAEHGGKLGDEEVRQIIERAVELESEGSLRAGAAETAESGALSLGGVEQVAAEVGIPPERVRQAARELEQPLPPVRSYEGYELGLPPPPAPGGAPQSTLVAERVVQGEVPPSAHLALVEVIQSSLGVLGHVSSVGSGLTWSPAAPGMDDRKVVVTVTPRDGQTTVHVEERLELSGWRLVAPGWGSAGGALLALLAITALGASIPAVVALVLLFATAGGVVTANSIKSTLADWRAPEIRELADRLADVAARTAEYPQDVALAPPDRARPQPAGREPERSDP